MKAENRKYFFYKGGMLLWFFLQTTSICNAQYESNGTKKAAAFVAYPLAYYSPETRWGAGLAGAINFRFNRNDTISPASQLSVGLGITQNNQKLISLPFAFYFKERLNTITGELTWNDYNYYFYGTGAGNNQGDRTKYTVQFPLFRINYLRKIMPHVFLGGRWWYEDYHISSFDKNMLLDNRPPGAEGSTTSGPGVVLLFDTRNSIYYSQKGIYLELVYQNQAKIWGSNFYYDRYRFDFRSFYPLNQRLTLANQIFGDFVSGSVPFNQMPGMGSGRRGRGFYEGRYRDKNLLLYQGELRGFFDKRWGMAAFWNYAVLASKLSSFDLRNDHGAVGFGVRYAFDISNKSNLRLDVAFPLDKDVYLFSPNDGVMVYFTVNEAF